MHKFKKVLICNHAQKDSKRNIVCFLPFTKLTSGINLYKDFAQFHSAPKINYSTHEKLLKKLKRHEPPTVNIKTTITADPETNTMESVSVISCEKSKKSKKKDKNGTGV